MSMKYHASNTCQVEILLYHVQEITLLSFGTQQVVIVSRQFKDILNGLGK